MSGEIFISSLILSLTILVPIGAKWEIGNRTSIPIALCVGVITGAIVNVVEMVWSFKFIQLYYLEFILIVSIATSLLLWRFYRDPERVPPPIENVILSPADGKIIYVKKIERGEIPFSDKNGIKIPLNDFVKTKAFLIEGYLIGISMNFLDVHVNRAPIGGRISLIKCIKGSFISLKKEEAIIKNARVLTVIDNNYFKIGIVQIASRLVRKILTYFKEGSEIQRGERIGMIRFGSQVDLILPNIQSLKIEVISGVRVKAGLSIIARF